MNLYPREPEYILDSQSEKTIHSSRQSKDIKSILLLLKEKQEHLSVVRNMVTSLFADIHTLQVELVLLEQDT